MEANKIKDEAKSLTTKSGVELTYCEKGQEHDEVIIAGAFYFHTFMPVIDELARHYHVYGVVMRTGGEGDEKNSDGSINWARQWGRDVYEFAESLGIKQFHYAGKCHGTVPGWYLLKEHPEKLLSFASFFLAPHLKPQVSNKWVELLSGGDASKMMAAAIRKPEGLALKMEELKSVGKIEADGALLTYGGFPERIWESIEACERDLRQTKVRVGFLFGTDDPLYTDHLESNRYIVKVVPKCRYVILQGERHLMELDCPKRVAREIMMNINESKEAE